jgi:hypothetical protein
MNAWNDFLLFLIKHVSCGLRDKIKELQLSLSSMDVVKDKQHPHLRYTAIRRR